VLQKQGLCHEAQSLARGLFELRLSFEAFVEQLQVNPRAACLRVMDTVMLEKIKQAHASDFKGCDLVLGAVTPNKFLEAGRDISKRYSPDELKRLK
jgi:hypothetical protein